nr:MAG TPA: hypothetical protein [Caudoviricetes sp.]
MKRRWHHISIHSLKRSCQVISYRLELTILG